MRSYTIPTRHREGFEKFFELGSKRDAVIKIFSSATIGQMPDEIEGILHDKLELSKDDSSLIVSSITSLFIFYSNVSDSVSEFTKNFVQALNDFIVDLEKDKSILTQLEKLLKNGTNYLVSIKALNLVYERERIINSFKILSDIRPVFEKEIADPRSALVLHTLEIQYQEEKRRKTDFFALDVTDLVEFQRQISRALEKDKFIKKKLESSLFKIINLD